MQALPLSIYIPSISRFISERQIMDEFGMTIGYVERVDFATKGKKRGFKEKEEEEEGDNDDNFVSAFVHFTEWYTSSKFLDRKRNHFVNVRNILLNLQNGKKFKYYCQILPERGYWVLQQNKSPIRSTLMNTHQIVANALLLEEHVHNTIEPRLQRQEKMQQYITEETRATIDYLEDHIASIKKENIDLKKHAEWLEEHLASTRMTVSQLIGGLFCQKTQRGMIDTHLEILYPERECTTHYKEDTDTGSEWPTTRQGDELEKKFALLEARIKEQESRFQEQESRFQEQESRFQEQESRFQEQESRFQEQESRFQEQEEDNNKLLFRIAQLEPPLKIHL